MHATLTAGISSLLISTMPVHSPAFFQSAAEFFLCYMWLTAVPVWARKIKCHPARRKTQMMKVPVLSARGTQTGSKTCVTVFTGLCYCVYRLSFRNCGRNIDFPRETGMVCEI